MSASGVQISSASGIMPNHHIPSELLLDYAGGNLAESWSLVVACHLTLCPHCRDGLSAIEEVGGHLLDNAEPMPLRAGSFEAVAAQLGGQDPAPGRSHATKGVSGAALIPAPLRSYLDSGIDDIHWRWSGAGLKSSTLDVPRARGGMVSLLRIAPGTGMPLHTHGGEEMTLVLHGGFTDETGEYRRGDVEIADGSVRHQPVAMEGEPCICLAVTDAPLRFSGPFGWVLNQWSRLST